MSQPCGPRHRPARACGRSSSRAARRPGGEEAGFRQQLRLQRQQVAEDARQRHHDVDARTAQLFERDEIGAGKPAVAVEARLSRRSAPAPADRPALGLQVVGAPQHQRDGLGQRGHPRSHAGRRRSPGARRRRPRRRSGSEGVEAVQVAPVGRIMACAEIAAGCRPDVAPSSARRSRRGSCRRRAAARSSASSRSSVMTTGGGRRLGALGEPRTSASIARSPALGGRRLMASRSAAPRSSALADDMQAVRDQRVFEFQHLVDERGDLADASSARRLGRDRARWPAPG
jgi:hypothetical protein